MARLSAKKAKALRAGAEANLSRNILKSFRENRAAAGLKKPKVKAKFRLGPGEKFAFQSRKSNLGRGVRGGQTISVSKQKVARPGHDSGA